MGLSQAKYSMHLLKTRISSNLVMEKICATSNRDVLRKYMSFRLFDKRSRFKSFCFNWILKVNSLLFIVRCFNLDQYYFGHKIDLFRCVFAPYILCKYVGKYNKIIFYKIRTLPLLDNMTISFPLKFYNVFNTW